MYLSKWSSVIPSMQADFINALMSVAVDAQSFTEAEAAAEADRLLRLLATSATRVLAQFTPVNSDELITSEAFNNLLLHLSADLTIAFTESNNLSSLLSIYQRLIQKRMIKELRLLIADLEQKVFMLKYLRDSRYGFDNIINFTFQDTSKRSFHSATLDSLLFRDIRSGNILTTEQDCYIDTLGKCLLPAIKNIVVNKYVKAELSSLQLANQLVSLDFPGSNLNNLIDGQPDSFWVVREVATQVGNEGLQVELSFDNGKYDNHSYIDIYPISDFPVFVTNLSYEDTKGARHNIDLSHNNFVSQDISAPGRLYFPTCRGRRLFLNAQQKSYTPISSSALASASAGELPSLPLSEVIMPQPSSLVDKDDFYAEYILGFDNILSGTMSCNNMGIYVSPEIKVDRCGAIGLEAEAEDLGRLAAVEYYVLKRDYGKGGSLLRSLIYPVLPLDQEAIVGEEAVFSEGTSSVNNITTLRFRAHSTTVPALQVYQEESLLSSNSYSFPDDFTTAEMTRINIFPAGNNKRFTVDYVPIHLNGVSPVYLNEEKTAWFMGNNVLYCSRYHNNIHISTSSIYLIIYFRLRAAQQDVVPRLTSCRLLTGSYGIEEI